MNVYLASIYASRFWKTGKLYYACTEAEKQIRDSVVYNLESFHYLRNSQKLNEIHKDKTLIFLDSGAFSFYSKGAEISLQEYCDFVRTNMAIIKYDEGVPLYSVLDNITSASKTKEAQLEMQVNGLTPLPCYHYGEPVEYLKYYLDNYPYITIGGMVPVHTKQLYIWLDELFSKYLLTNNGTLRCKVHGFGLTAHALMLKYPWTSVDSSTWVQQGNFGMLNDVSWGTINVSALSTARKQAGRHYDNMSVDEQQFVLSKLASKGLELSRCQHNYWSRWCYNIDTFIKLGTHIKDTQTTFALVQETLF